MSAHRLFVLIAFGALRSALGAKKKHRRSDCDFDAVDGKTLTREQFEEVYRNEQPVLILNLTDSWQARQRWQSPHFVEHYGDMVIPRPGVQTRFGVAPTLREYVTGEQRAFTFDTLDVKRHALQWLRSDFTIPDIFLRVYKDPILSLAGSFSKHEDRGLSFHQHEENWLSLISGQKQWYIKRPDGPMPRNAKVQDSTQLWAGEVLAQQKGVLSCTQHEGDTIYVPDKWWHATYNELGDASDLTVAIGGWGDSTPVMAAAVFGSVEMLQRVAGQKTKRRRQAVRAVNNLSMQPIHLAQNVDVLDFLHKYGADVNAQDHEGNTPLTEAARACMLPNLEWLVDRGASVQHTNSHGESAFVIACQWCGEIPVLDFFLKHSVDVNQRTQAGFSPLQLAVEKGQVAAAQWLVDNGADLSVTQSGKSPLMHSAVASNNGDMIEWLVSRRGNVAETGADATQPIHIAAGIGATQAMEALVKHGADIRAKLPNGFEAVHMAASWGRVEVLAWLKERGADLQVRAAAQGTPLDMASSMAAQGHISVDAKLFLESALSSGSRADL